MTDFGLAKVEDALGLSQTGHFAGTPYYMSPEQARGDAASIAETTDVYALGGILYECLTGKRAFAGETVTDVIGAVVHKAFVAVDEAGTEAAAATAVVMVESARPEPGVEMRVDRPFIFLIRDVPSGTILFLGWVVDPGA